jgi:signal transduction histidine kinase
VKGRLRSILWRIISLHVLALALAAAAMLATVVALLNSTAARVQHVTLRRHEQAILSALHQSPQGWRLDLSPALRTLYANGYAGYAFSVLGEQRQVLFSSAPQGGALIAIANGGERPVYFQFKRGVAVYNGGSFPEMRQGSRVWIQVAQDLENPDVVFDDIVALYLQRVGWLVAPILLFLLVVDVFIVRRALQPVLDASRRAEAITPSNLSVRLNADALPSEIEPLAKAVNQALDRLEEGFNRQREFTGDAAHELRTPLAILRMRVEALGDREVAAPLVEDIEAMTRVVSQLLEMAELDALLLDPAQKTDLHELGARVVAYMAPYALARRKRIALTGAGRPVWVHGDSDVLFQAVRNLVENAIEHTPVRRAVEVEVLEPGTLRVLDSGPGVTGEERELIFRRFWRRSRRSSKGAGLGLSIVSRIVETHGGQVRVENRPQGGAAFVIELRPAEPGEPQA